MFKHLLNRHQLGSRLEKNIFRLLKIIFIVIPIILFFNLVNSGYLLTSTISYTYHPGKITHIIRPVTPTTLIKSSDPKLPWKVSVDSFPFNVTIPRLIEAVRVRVRFNPGTAQFVTLNAQTKTGGAFSTIVSSVFLDKLNWKHVTEGNMTLWMRDKHTDTKQVTTGTGKNTTTKTVTTETAVKQYSSINQLRSDPPNPDRVATSGYDRMAFASIAYYKPSITPITINHTFRGSHQLYVYAANENIHITFDKIDLNRQKGADTMTVRIGRADQMTGDGQVWLKTITIPDDGNSRKDNIRGKLQHIDLVLPNVSAGTYLVDILTNEDVLFKNMTSYQYHLAFNGRVFLAAGPAYAESDSTMAAASFITNGSTVNLAANHDQGKQTVIINGIKIKINDVKINHTASGLFGDTNFDLAKGDAIISGDGLLTIAPAELIPDGTHLISLSTPPDLTNYDYLIAEYVPHQTGDLVIDHTYKVSDLALNVKTLTFSIESPGMTAAGTTLGLQDIKATLIRGPFPWDKIWKKLSGKK